ncbi:TPA: ESPR domain-containing protein, partial [Mannheimia haemolytica]
MNKIFKVKKNALGQSVACSELATSRSKALLVSAVLAVASVGATAQPASSWVEEGANKPSMEWLDEEQMNTPEGSIISEWKKGQDISWTLEDFMSKNRGFIYDLHEYLGNTNDDVEANREEITNRAEGLQAQITANQADTAKNFADTDAKVNANADALKTKVEQRDFYYIQDNVNNNNTEIAKLQANKADVKYVDDTIAETVGYVNSVAEETDKNAMDIATNKADIIETV